MKRKHRQANARRRTLQARLPKLGASFETLEERVVLNAAPIGIPDLSYVTNLNTAITTTSANDLYENGDFDPEGSSLTASIDTNPANGTLSSWNGTAGTWTYTPNTGFQGQDSFTYTVSDGTATSEPVTVRIGVGKYLGAMTNLEDAARGSSLLTGELELADEITPGVNVLYNSNTVNPKPIIVVETFLKTTSSKPSEIKAQLTLNGTAGTQYTYVTTPLQSGDSMRFALQGDASALATGRYAWSMKITTVYSGVSTDHTYTGNVDVVNRSSSTHPFGRGWQLEGLDSLVAQTGGVLMVKDTGDALWFADDGSGGYKKADGDVLLHTLVKNGNNTYTLTDKHGIVSNFGTTGLLTSRVDRNSNTWTYGYTSNLLTTITDPFSRTTTLSYTSGRLTGVSDFASRSASLTYDTTNGYLATIVGVDPDGAGGAAAGVTTFTTNSTTHKVTNREDAIGNDTGFTYSTSNGTLTTITHPNSDTTSLTALQTRGLPTGTTGNALTGLSVYATLTSGHSTNFDLDRFGNPIEIVDGLSNKTIVQRNYLGLPVKITSADPDGAGSLTSSVIVMGYSATTNNLVYQKNPDNSTRTTTYSSTFNLPTSVTDELSRVEEMAYDSYGNMTSYEDAGGYVWTFTYTSRGLVDVATTPDPDAGGSLTASATDHNYDSYGRLTTRINPDSSDMEWTYNTADQVLTEVDELNHTTTYTVDSLDRVTKVTDREGAEFDFVYNAVGWLTESRDPYDKDTDYTYNSRGWLTQKDSPDPDGAGSLSRPSQTWDYNAAGQVIEEGSFSWTGGAGVLHTYNAAGWKTSTAGPLSGKTMNYTFDNMGRVTQAADSINYEYDTTQYVYDSSSRVTQVKRQDADGAGPLGQPTETYGYNAAGELTSYTDPRGYTTTYAYNSRGLLDTTTLADPDGAGALASPIVVAAYDNIGRKISETDPLGRVTAWAYNNRHWVTSVTMPDPDQGGSLTAPVVSFGWDAAGRRTSVTDALSRVTTSAFDHEGRETQRTHPDPDGAGSLTSPVEEWDYNLAGSLVLYTDPRGNETAFDYDYLQREITRTLEDPDGGGSLTSPVYQTQYGANGQVSKLIDPLSHETTFQYDTIGRRTGVTDHQGNQTTTAYNTFNQVTSIVTPDPDGAGSQTASTTSYAYNKLNEVATITDALSGVTSFTYDVGGNLLTLDDPVGNTTTWAYDGLGQPTIETNELSYSRSFLHDAAGNLTRYTDRNGRVIQYVRDDLARVTEEKWLENATPAPSVAIATTTQGGSVNEVQRVGFSASMFMGGTFTITHNGQTTSPLSYNASAASVKSALEALSSVGTGNVDVVATQTGSFTYEWRLTFQNSKAGTNVAQSTVNTTNISAMGSITKIEATDTTGGVFDEVQTVTVSNATGGTFRLAFLGQTSAPIAYNASASTVETTLEALNSVDNVTVTGSAGGPWTVTFAGSHVGTNVAAMNGDATTLTNGTLTRTISFVYDAASQLTSTTDPDSSYAYTYDADGRVTSVDNNGTSGVPRVILSSVYDAASNRTSLSSTIAGTADFKNTSTFDTLNRLTRIDQAGQSGGNTVAEKRVDFSYNAISQFATIARYKDTDGGSTHEVATSSFTFDTLNRLTGLAYKKGGTDLFTAYSFSYDTLGRITSTTTQDGTTAYSYDKTSQLTAADHSYQTDESYSFDANGNRTMTGYTTGSNNRLTGDGTYTYSYDDEGNRTLRTKTSDGSKTEYGWDYRNRLIRITEKTSSNVVTKETLYTYDQFDRRLSKSVDPDGPGSTAATVSRYVYDGDNIVLVFGGSAASSLKNRYLHGPAVDQILADEQVTSLSSAGTVLWPLADNQGTIRDLVNNSGVAQNHLKFGSFGAVASESNAAVDHLFGFTGRERDEESGLNFYRARYYDADVGRFTVHDPVGFTAHDMNLSRYVNNSPSNFRDPFGLQVFEPGIGIQVTANPTTPSFFPWIDEYLTEGLDIANLHYDPITQEWIVSPFPQVIPGVTQILPPRPPSALDIGIASTSQTPLGAPSIVAPRPPKQFEFEIKDPYIAEMQSEMTPEEIEKEIKGLNFFLPVNDPGSDYTEFQKHIVRVGRKQLIAFLRDFVKDNKEEFIPFLEYRLQSQGAPDAGAPYKPFEIDNQHINFSNGTLNFGFEIRY